MKISTIATLLLTGAGALYGMEFQSLGYKSTAMGGAGVAGASGALAGYYNPALLAHAKYEVEVSLGAGVQFRDNGLGPKVQKLSDDDFFDALDNVIENAPNSGGNTPKDSTAVADGVATIMTMDGESLQVQPSAYVGVQVQNFLLGLYITSEAAVIGNVDPQYDQLIVENGGSYYRYDPATDTYSPSTRAAYESSSIDYALNEDKTDALAFGVLVGEIPLSYAYDFAIPSGRLSVGGSAKIMQAYSYFRTMRIDNEDDDSDEDYDKLSTSFGLDLGVHYVSSDVEGLGIGMVVKNLNSPTFDTMMDGKEITLDPMVRVGVSYMLLDSLEFAADLDLTDNEMIVEGMKSRMFGGGLGWQPVSWFNLSGGLMKNLSNSDEGLIYTAGFGLGPETFHLDLAAQITGQQNSYEGTSVPRYADVMISLNSCW